jgi:hypothetical protein
MVRAASRGLLKGLGRVCGSLGAYRTLERKSKALVHVYGPWLNREPAANGDRGNASWPGAAAAARAAPRSQFPCLQCALGRGDVFEFFVDALVFKELRACRARTAGSAGRRHRAARAVLQASHGLPPALEPALVRRASCHQTCFFLRFHSPSSHKDTTGRQDTTSARRLRFGFSSALPLHTALPLALTSARPEERARAAHSIAPIFTAWR